MKIWAHRGCSLMYPENTLLAFEKAAELKGLTGIELDIQLTDTWRYAMTRRWTEPRTEGGCSTILRWRS